MYSDDELLIFTCDHGEKPYIDKQLCKLSHEHKVSFIEATRNPAAIKNRNVYGSTMHSAWVYRVKVTEQFDQTL